MPARNFLSDEYKEVSLAFLGSDLPFFCNSFSSYYLCFVDLIWHPPSHKDEIFESSSAFSGISKTKTAVNLSGTG